MERNLKNELKRIFTLMEYNSSKDNKFLLKEQEDNFPFRMNRVGGGIRVQDAKTGDHIDIPYDLIDDFFAKLSEFKKP